MWHLFSSRTASRRPRRSRTHRAMRPRLEAMEGRVVLSAPAFDSVLAVGSDTSAAIPYDNAVDAAGNVYVTGTFYGTQDFDPAVARADGSDVLTPRGSSNIFVAKYAPDNTLVWARRMGSDFILPPGRVLPLQVGDSIAVDGNGTVYVTGSFAGRADFGPFNLDAAGSSDVFVAKLDANGSVLWAKGWGGATQDEGKGIALDPAGNVISMGRTATVFSDGSFTPNGTEVRKYSPTGAAVWTKRIDGYVYSTSMATDAAGNIALGGSFKGTVDFNPDPRKTNSVTGGSTSSGFVLQLTAAGAYSWVAPFLAKTTGSPGATCDVRDIAFDSTSNVIVGGSYRGQVDFNPSAKVDYRLPNIGAYYDGFVAKLSPAGALTWATPLGGASVSSLTVDTSGSVYAVGTFSSFPFTPGFGLPTVTSNGIEDVFVTRLTASGAVDWAVTFGGSSHDHAEGIALGPDGTIYVAGYSWGTVDFDPDPSSTFELTNPNYADMFLLKLKRR